MRIVTLGGGPAALYFAILMKKSDASHEVTVLERNAPDQTFGWGVVFSDETLGYLQDNDPDSAREITETFAHWDAIDVHFRGQRIRSRGHGFSGISRKRLLAILQRRASALGVELRFESEVTDPAALMASYDLVVAADGVNSLARKAFADTFRPSLDPRVCKYIWLGTTMPFEAFTFFFEENHHGMFQVHAYKFDASTSTFIVECDEASWRAAGLDVATSDQTVAYLEALFAKHLNGHRLLTNRSAWIHFVTVRNARWRHENLVLLGDAAHTAHFSIGSGTKLAMEDSIALCKAFEAHADIPAALEAYESERRPVVERTQKAAHDSLVWFENVKRYKHLHPVQFAFSLLTRSKRITYENLKLRDPEFAREVTAWFSTQAQQDPSATAAPPMFVPFTLGDVTLRNRVVVSPMCMYSATDGTPDDFHLVHYGSLAMGGAGLVFTEMTDVSAEGRITPGCTGMYAPAHVEAWARIVWYVHKHSGARIALQLGHAGRKGATKLMWEGMDQPLSEGAWPLLAPSALPYLPHGAVPRAMDRTDMSVIIGQYVRATEMALAAGFDMLEVHMAHGYLLASFISPLTNHRADDYGGGIEGRMRFPLEVLDAVRAAWPRPRPLSVRVSATDWAPGGLTDEDLVVLAKALKSHGCDVIDVSTGQTSPASKPVFGRMFQLPWSDLIRQEVGIPTMSVGNIANADQVNTIVASGRADLCVLARPHLNDPHWTLHAAADQGYDAQPWPVQYAAGRTVAPKT